MNLYDVFKVNTDAIPCTIVCGRLSRHMHHGLKSEEITSAFLPCIYAARIWHFVHQGNTEEPLDC